MDTWSQLNPLTRALLDAHGGERVVVIRPSLVRALKGNGNAALVLCQFIYWSKRTEDPDGWFFDSQAQLEEQTGLGADAQLRARKVLKGVGLIEEKRKGVPAKLYYRVNLERVAEVITEHYTPRKPTTKKARPGDAEQPPVTRTADSGQALLPVSGQAPKLDSGQVPRQETGQVPRLLNRLHRDYEKTHTHLLPASTLETPLPSRRAPASVPVTAIVSVNGKSQFSLEECIAFANHLHESGLGINNPGGYATSVYRSGEADALIDKFLHPQCEVSSPVSAPANKGSCPDCHGTGFWYPAGLGRGVARCQHPRLTSHIEEEIRASSSPPDDGRMQRNAQQASYYG